METTVGFNHSFDVEHARLYGVNCAILIYHIQFWIRQNQKMGRNFHDGRTWMYQTQKEIAAIYDYWSEDMVFRILKKLVDNGVLITGNFNKTQFDQTKWYAFKNEEMFTIPRNCGIELNTNTEKDSADSKSPFRGIAEPIPDTKTDTDLRTQSVVAAPPATSKAELQKTKELPPDELPDFAKVQISPSEILELSQSELYARVLRARANWSTEAIRYAWKTLCEYTGIVYDWWRFIEGTATNYDKKIKSINITKSRGKICNHKNQNTKNYSEDTSDQSLLEPVSQELVCLGDLLKKRMPGWKIQSTS